MMNVSASWLVSPSSNSQKRIFHHAQKSGGLSWLLLPMRDLTLIPTLKVQRKLMLIFRRPSYAILPMELPVFRLGG